MSGSIVPQLTMVQGLPDEEEDCCDAVSVESVNGCIEKSSLLLHILVPLQAVRLSGKRMGVT